MNIYVILTLFSSIPFLFYGIHCLFSEEMAIEFERFKLKDFRLLTGSLEIAGGLGQVGGFWFPQLGFLSSLGLALLMVCGVWARWRIRDPFLAFIPAVALGLNNLILVWLNWKIFN